MAGARAIVQRFNGWWFGGCGGALGGFFTVGKPPLLFCPFQRALARTLCWCWRSALPSCELFNVVIHGGVPFVVVVLQWCCTPLLGTTFEGLQFYLGI